jgi:pilus assembly protein CpaB
MRGRPILLVLGTLALVAGAALVVFQLQAPAPAVEVVAKVESQAVLVMARSVKARTLLRPDDLAWRPIAMAAVPTGSYLRGTATEGDFAGAVVRKDLAVGAILTAEQVVRAGEPGFLPAVLNDGMRATSIAVGLAEGASGLIVPGDHVDVVLIQNFAEAGVELSHRSVGETVLSDLRVIAIDQKTTTDTKPRGPEPAAGTAAAAAAATAAAVEPRIAKTVTLEVTVRQAEVLMVAQQLGKIQLTLRDADDEKAPVVRSLDAPPPVAAPPTWGADVSPALDGLGRDRLTPTTGNSPPPLPSPPPSAEVKVYHGPTTESRCFDDMGKTATDCTTPTAVPPGPAPAGPVPTIPVPTPATPGTPVPATAVPAPGGTPGKGM